MEDRRIYLWDLPTRLFHWMLVAAVIGAVVTGLQGGAMMDWHARFGLSIVGLLVFRLVWGFAGSTYARFVQFFPTPRKIAVYFRGGWDGHGHSPVGALSALSLLAVLTVQVATGLVGNDDITFSGPLSDLVTKRFSDRMTGIHQLLANGIYVLVALHVGAILYYQTFQKKGLLRPMITGWKAGDPGDSARGGGLMAFGFALIVASAAVYGASGAWLPAPPPPVAGETPNF